MDEDNALILITIQGLYLIPEGPIGSPLPGPNPDGPLFDPHQLRLASILLDSKPYWATLNISSMFTRAAFVFPQKMELSITASDGCHKGPVVEFG